FVSKAFAGRIAITRWCKQGPQKQQDTVWVLVMPSECLGHQILRVTTDLRHCGLSVQPVAITAFNAQFDFRAANLIKVVVTIKQTNEWADSTGSVVILGLAE